MSYKIIGDSCTDLPDGVLTDEHFKKIPLIIHVGEDTIVDDETFCQRTLLEKMKACPQAPKTACPSPADYLACFGPEGDHYVVTLSGKLSGPYNAAMQARAIYREEGRV